MVATMFDWRSLSIAQLVAEKRLDIDPKLPEALESNNLATLGEVVAYLRTGKKLSELNRLTITTDKVVPAAIKEFVEREQPEDFESWEQPTTESPAEAPAAEVPDLPPSEDDDAVEQISRSELNRLRRSVMYYEDGRPLLEEANELFRIWQNLKNEAAEAKKNFDAKVSEIRFYYHRGPNNQNVFDFAADEQAAPSGPIEQQPVVVMWRSTSMAEFLKRRKIKGFGKKKAEALCDCCETIGKFEDLRVEAGKAFKSVHELLPDLIGQELASALEEAVIQEFADLQKLNNQQTATAEQSEQPQRPKMVQLVRDLPEHKLQAGVELNVIDWLGDRPTIALGDGSVVSLNEGEFDPIEDPAAAVGA